ncbi:MULTISPECIES: putative quinol monooxygenase [Bradyrhizobium]|uniref:Antibiotic biosynthesis monooxygenase n=1 Tax=Bradyrhizobium icense TaxID=1274631 RepID=A0A1B1UA62_9BRAD|nr:MULTISPECIES: putative quinol monooxygenase [Bradyrhizobium]ANV99631.1 antibiotic biosynthesis monooxygenase [Bradyrhizobium icense]
MTIVVSVKYVLKPGKRDELLSFVMDNVKNTRKENGNLAYSHYPSLENEQEMFVFEMWETLKDLENHINMPHYVAFDDRRKPLLESYEAQVYEATLCRSTNKAPRAN